MFCMNYLLSLSKTEDTRNDIILMRRKENSKFFNEQIIEVGDGKRKRWHNSEDMLYFAVRQSLVIGVSYDEREICVTRDIYILTKG